MIYIVAGNHNEADYWAGWAELKREEWSYVADGRSLVGIRRPLVWFVGTFRDRSDWNDIRISLLQQRRIQITVVADR